MQVESTVMDQEATKVTILTQERENEPVAPPDFGDNPENVTSEEEEVYYEYQEPMMES